MEQFPTVPNKIIQHDLISLVNNGKITIAILSQITKIDQLWFEDFIQQKKDIKSISLENVHFLTDLVSVLSLGMKIEDDKRLKGIIEVLNQIYDMDIKTLANCIEIPSEIIVSFMKDSNSIPLEQKYTLAIKIMLIYYIFKFPNYEK